MSASRPTARDLFALAREDGPTAEERDALFADIALATSVGVAAAGASAATSTAPSAATTSATVTKAATTATGMKLLAVGGIFGAVTTALGVVVAFTIGASEAPRPPASDALEARTHARSATPGATLAGGGAARRRDPRMDARDPEPAASAVATEGSAAAPAARAPDPSSDLAEEARLVTEARRALLAGDPARALTLIQATRKLSARALEPEELGLEARALHALGRVDDAAATELVLRRRHPDHALAR
ncbi:MAG: hypothetical protein KF819_19695 [Labilithrix sp.]|nr:hypothetical protein [Labilithrix sp.]